MKVGKSFTTFLALGLLLGLGVWNSADAVSATAVVVTSPAAGETLNIADNDVVVEITFTELNAAMTNKAFEVHVGLANITVDPLVELTTLDAAATGLILDDATDAGEEALLAATGRVTLPAGHVTGGSGRVLGNVIIPYFTAALSNNNVAPNGAANDTADLFGNVTAADIDVTNFDNVTITVTLSVGSDAGTADDIVAFAVVTETTGSSTGALVFSPIAGAFDGDWDGPEIGTIVLTAFTERLDADGVVIADPGIVAGSSHAPIAPGDRITVEVSATGTTQDLFFVDRTLGVDVAIAGTGTITTLSMDPSVRSAAGAATQSYVVQEDDDPDADGNGPDVGDKVRVIATVTSVDENGNPSANETGITAADLSAAITVTGNTREAVYVGVSAAGETALDTNPPTLAFAESPGVLPADGGVISDGGRNDDLPDDGFGNAAIDTDGDAIPDIEAIDNAGLLQYENEEAWKTFTVNFDDGADVSTTLTLGNDGNSLLNSAFDAAAPAEVRFVDFSDLSAAGTALEVTAGFDAAGERANTSAPGAFSSATTPSVAFPLHGTIPTGAYTVTYQAWDLADNASNALVASNVWVDVDDFAFESLAPPATETTINENTANPAYELGEAVSVLELTIATGDPASALLDTDAPHAIYAAGSFLSDTEVEHLLPVTDLLVDNAVYSFTFRIRDVAGNWNSIVNTPNRTYDVDFDEAIISKFAIAVLTVDNLAGVDNSATIQAQADDDRGAGTYDGTAVLMLDCTAIQADTCENCEAKAFPDCSGVSITGEGVAATGDGIWSLDSEGWDSIGLRDIDIDNDSATIEFTLTVDDNASEGGPYTGTSDAVSYMPEVYAEINIWNGDAAAGSQFSVNVEATDEFGNIRWEDERLINLGANRPANLPGSVLLEMGTGTVWATASAGPLDILASDPIALDPDPSVNGDNFLTGDLSVDVGAGDGPSAPDQVVADDYLGADGEGDQGGFIVLTFTVPDGSNASGYQISREVTVFYDVDANGDLVHLGDEGADADRKSVV